MTKKIFALSFTLLFLLHAASVFGEQAVRIGFIAPFSGPRASFGNDALAAAKIAITDLHAPIELVLEDSQGDPRQGVSAYQSLRARGIKFIMTMNSNISLAVSAIAIRDNAIQLAFCTTADSFSTPNDNTFRINGSTVDEARAQAAFLVQKISAKPGALAVITIEDEYPINLRRNLLKELASSGITPVLNETFMPNANDFRQLISKLRSSGSSYLVLLSYQTEAGVFMKQLKQQRVSLNLILGSTPIRNREYFDAAGEAGEGIFITYFKFNESMPAAGRLREAGLTINIPTSQGYDGMLVANDALKKCNYNTSDAACVRKALFSAQGIQGLTGTKTMDRVYGDMTDEYHILVARNGNFVKYSE